MAPSDVTVTNITGYSCEVECIFPPSAPLRELSGLVVVCEGRAVGGKSCEYYYTRQQLDVSESDNKKIHLSVHILQPQSIYTLTLGCIYNDLRITAPLSTESFSTPDDETSIPAAVSFCCMFRELEGKDIYTNDLKGMQFGVVSVNPKRREITVRSGKKDLSIPLHRIGDIFFFDSHSKLHDSQGIAVYVGFYLSSYLVLNRYIQDEYGSF